MTIKTWQEQARANPWGSQLRLMQAEIDELRAALDASLKDRDALTAEFNEQRSRSREWRESATFAVESLKKELAGVNAKVADLEKQKHVATHPRPQQSPGSAAKAAVTGACDTLALQYMALSDAMGYDSGPDSMTSPEEFATDMQAKLSELEANERAYTRLVGKRSYQEVADALKRLEAWERQEPGSAVLVRLLPFTA